MVIAMCVGAALTAVVAGRVRPWVLAAAVSAVFLAGGVALTSRAWDRAWRPSLRLLFEAAAHDARVEALRGGRSVPVDDRAVMVVSGVLRSDAAPTESGAVSMALDAEWAGRVGGDRRGLHDDGNPAEGGVLITVVGVGALDRRVDWRAGRRIRAPVDLRRVARYLDPGVPDAERSLARRGITLVGTVKSATLVDVLERGSAFQEGAASARALARRAVQDAVGGWSPQAAAIVSAIVIGDRTGLDNGVERRLQEAGTYHVIAISGGNIAILAGLILALFRWLGMLGRTAMVTAAGVLVLYGQVVDGGASVDRAVLMASVYFMGRGWDLRGPPLQPLTLAAGILLLSDPLSVVDPASILTFGATAGIIAVAPLLHRVRLPALCTPLAGLLLATAAAEAVLMPVSATLFSRVTFAGLLLNFAAIPLMAVAQLAGMAVVPLWVVWPAAARLAGWAAYVGAEGLVRSADVVALMPWATWRVVPPPVWAIAAYYAAGAWAWLLWKPRGPTVHAGVRQGRRARLPALLVALGVGAWMIAPQWTWRLRSDGALHVTFLDVGQGDAALVRFPRGASLLVDAGGSVGSSSFDIGDRVVGPVLRGSGVGRLGTLAVSHGDADHAGGARSVVDDFRPMDVWEGVPVPPSALMQRLRSDALQRAIRWTTLQRADTTTIDGVDVRVLHPPVPDWERQDVRNDDSVVLELRWREVSIVFTGDIGREIEEGLVPTLVSAPLRLLKVPHHGSNTSSSERFLRALAPDVAVVSVGRSNGFGHPSPAVLARYQAVGTALFRTDMDGAVQVDTDGHSLEIRTISGRRLRVTPKSTPTTPTGDPPPPSRVTQAAKTG